MSIASRHIRNSGKLLSSTDGPSWQARNEDSFVDHRFALDFALRAAGTQSGAADLASATAALGAPVAVPLPPEPTLEVASTLSGGQAAIIGYNTGQTDSNGTTLDSLEFVILAPIGSGTIIRFTDRTWVPTPGSTTLNAGTFTAAAGDGSFAFTAGADLAAGTVISATFSGGNVVFTVNGVASAPISAGGFDPNEAGDAIYVYQGSDANTPTGFLSAIEIGDGNATFGGSLVNTGLVNGVTAVSTALDSATYHGPTTDAFAHFFNGERLLENIMDSTNWVGDDADGQKALDQPNHSGPYNVSPNLGLWVAGQGGGQALVHVGGDPTVSSGQFGYNLTQLYTNHSTLVGGARDVVFDTVEGKFFLAEGERILQGNISDLLGNPSTPVALTVLYTGTKPDGMPIQFGDNNIFNLELDTVNNIIYFSHGSQISKIVYNTAGQTATVLADFNVGNPVAGSNRNHVDDFAIHFASGSIYASSHRITSGQDGDQLTKNYVYRITGLDAADGTNAFTFGNGLITFLPFAPDDDDAHNGFTWVPGEGFPQEEGTLEGVAISADGNTLYFTAASTLYDHDGDGGFAGDGNPGTTDPQLRMGGVFSYALTGNPTGLYTQIWQQLDDGDTVSQAISHTFGPQGLLDDIEYDPVTGHLYFLDQTGDQLGIVNPPGDEGIWRIATNGTGLTYFANINNISAMGPSSIWLNHAPTVTSSTQATPTVTEPGGNPGTNSGATALVQPFTALDVTDHESAGHASQQLAGAIVWISNNFQSGVTHQDTLTINGLTSGTANGITFSYNSATGAMTLTGADTFADYETAIALVRFNTSGDNPTNYGAANNRTISWAVSDGLGHSDPVSTTVDVIGVNDAPVNTPGAAMNFTEDTIGVIAPTVPVNAITGISVFDVDADPATQDIIVTLSVAVGTLNIRTDVTGGLAAGEVTGQGTGTLVLTGTQNQINATLAATNMIAQPNGLVYTPPANYNGATNLTITTNDNGFNGNDSGNTGTAASEQDQDVKVINIADVNDAPTVGGDGTEAAADILEDQPWQQAGAPPPAAASTVAMLFGGQFSDATDIQFNAGSNPNGSTGDVFAGIAIVSATSNANGAWQYWDGDSWENIGGGSQAAARTITGGTQIRFNPTLNYNGPAPSLTVHLIETGGPAITNNGTVNLSPVGTATGGTTVYSSGTVVLSQNVTPVNDAPTSANLNGDTVTWTEGSGAIVLDSGAAATLADVDSPNFDTGTLTIAISGGVVAQDGLFVEALGGISTGPGTVSFMGTQIGTFTGGGFGGGSLVFTFDADATLAAVQALLRAISYNNNAGDDPTDGDRTVNWTLVDGDGQANTGQDTLNLTTTVDVDPVNDAPQGADETITIDEDGSHTFNAGNFNFTDPLDGDSFAGVVLTTLPASGDLYLNNVLITVAGTFVTIGDINSGLLTYEPDPNGNGPGYATFTFQVRDNGGILDGGVDTDPNPDTITFNVNAFNDAPVNTLGGTVVINEDAVDAPLTGMSIFDVDAGSDPITVILEVTDGVLNVSETVAGGLTAAQISGNGTDTVTIIASQSQINATFADAAGVLYTPDANFHGDDTLTVTTNDGGASGADAPLEDIDTRTITVNSVNDEPAGADKTVTASEDDPYVFTAADFGFTDPIDGDDFAGVVLTTLPVEGDLRLNGVNITVAGTFITAVDIAAGLLTFLADPDESGDAYASFTFQVRDDGGILNGGVDTDQSANTITIDVEPDNIAPTLDLDGDDSNTVGTGYTASFTEGGAAVPITDTDVAIVDPDVGGTIEGATITINGAVTGDQLVLADQAAPFVVTGSGTGTITITGSGTAAQYEAMLEQITFTNTSDDPGTTRTINVTVTDGVATSNIAVATINITEINDEPTLAATAVNPTFTEGGAAVDLFSGVTADTIEAGQTFVSLTLTVTNVTDGANEILVVDGVNVALTNGNVVATPAGNATVTLASGTATLVVGPSTLGEAALQTLIDGLAYLNTSENPTDANRVVTITQLVDSGSDTSPNDATLAPNIASTVNVNPVNDTPLNTVPGTQTINEDASVTLSTGNGNAIQVADADATTLTVTLTVLHGTLTLASTLGLSFGAGDGTSDLTMTFSGTTAAINAALGSGLTYNPNANFNGSDSIAVFTTDNGQSGGAAETDSDSVTINITAINDAPVVIGDGTESATTIDEDTPGAGQTIQALFAGQYSDAADNQVPNGGASSPGQFSGIAVTANGSSAATGQWQYFSGGVWTDIGAASDAAAKLLGDPFVTLIRFDPAPDFNGPAPTLTVHLIDNSLPFGIVNGQVVDLSGPGATGGTTAYSTGTVVLSQSVTAVNDGPENTVPGTQSINEDASVTFSTGNGNALSVEDVDATTLTVTLGVTNGTLTLASTLGLSFSGGSDGTNDATMTFSGTAAAINAALGAGLTYNPNAHYFGSDSLTMLTSDGGQTGTGGTLTDSDSITINIASVNDAPSSTGGSVTGSEDDPYVFTAADFNFSDPVEGDGFFAVQITTLPASGDILLNGAPVLAGDFIAVSAINAGMLTFQPDPDGFGSPYTTFTFRVQDSGGVLNGGVDTDPTPRTMTINVTPDNLAPEVDLNGAGAGLDAAVSYTEDSPGVSIGSGITVSDPNEVTGDLIESATITLTDAVAGDALTVTLPLPGGITAVTTNPAGQIVVTLSGAASTADYAAAIAQVLYSNTTNDDPTLGGTDPTRTITVTVDDGMLSSAVATSTVTITPLDDAPDALDDDFTTDEATAIVAGSVFADNGFGPDADPDGPPLQVGTVNGSPANVGVQIVLASGALLTLNANGTFDYDPNGVFDHLPGPLSGASNLFDTDTFTYTLVGGATTATVEITVTGVDSDGDILLGTPGVDSLDGGIGADTMTGFAGNDTYFVDNAGDTVVEVAGEGSDTIRTSISYTLAAGLSIETLTTTSQAGTGAIDLTGNELDNRIEGNDGVNALIGNGGVDLIYGHGGDDTLTGGVQNDLLDGGAGFDTTLFADSFVTYSDTLAGWIIASSEGSDIARNVEAVVDGSGRRTLLVGATGLATLQEALDAAADTNQVRLAAGSYDISPVSYMTSSLVVVGQTGSQQNVTYNNTVSGVGITVIAANLADTIATDDGDDRVFGNGGIDNISTGAGNDILNGGDGADVLSGGAGNDSLTGGAGNDAMSGGADNDIYHVTEAGDVVTEAAAGGTDIVYSSVSYSLNDGSEVESLGALSFTGTTALNFAGNGLANTLLGNDGNNQLNGRGGADTMVGRAGNDTYLVDNAGDKAFEAAGGGTDIIYSAVSYTLANDQEIESLSTITWELTDAIDLTGNGLNNSLIGNAGMNRLDGKGGNDALHGKEGADTFAFTTALGAGNVDSIYGFVSGQDRIELDNAVFSQLVDGALNANAFVVGTAATTLDHRIVYNNATGQLFYDADGVGGGAAVLFAALNTAPVLAHSDFTVI